jgi:hypothetical protein
MGIVLLDPARYRINVLFPQYILYHILPISQQATETQLQQRFSHTPSQKTAIRASPAGLSTGPWKLKLDEEKFGSAKWFRTGIFAQYAEAVKGHSKAENLPWRRE